MKGVSVRRRRLPAGGVVEIVHRASDPTIWIVRRRRKTLFGLRDVSVDWFNLETDAEAFAASLAAQDEAPARSR